MCIDSPKQLEGLMRIGQLVGLTLQHMKTHVQPGITTGELDALADAYLKAQGARSAPRITYNYPGATCISINDEAAHGIPGKRAIRKGDLVKLDVSAELDGYFADAAITVGVPPLTPIQEQLITCAQETLEAAIQAAKAGVPLNQIGRAAEKHAKRRGYRIIRDLPGHGVGTALHEEPDVYNHYVPRANQKLANGLVITVEPHITPGKGRIHQGDDGWTLKTTDGKLAANFEHTLVVTSGEALLVTAV